MTTLIIIWAMLIVALIVTAALFLLGALAVERATPDGDKDCTCKQTRWAVYADIDCPIHGKIAQ